MSLSKLAIELRSGKASLRELLQDNKIPENLFDLLICDYVSRVFLREEQAERNVDKQNWEAIKIKRLWIQKKVDNFVLGKTRAAIQEKMLVQKNQDMTIHFAWAVTHSSPIRSLDAIIKGIEKYNHFCSNENNLKNLELRWLECHFADLIEHYERQHQRLIKWLESKKNKKMIIENLRQKGIDQQKNAAKLLSQTYLKTSTRYEA